MAKDPFLSGRRLSWATAVLTGAAAFGTMAWLRDTAPGAAAFDARMARLAAHAGTAVAGWALRMVAVAFLLAFFVALSRALTPGHPILRSVAVQLATIGAAAEFIAATAAAAVLPAVAKRLVAGEADLAGAVQTFEAAVAAVSGALGAGLLAVSGALLAHAAFRTTPFPRALALSSLPIWAVGVAAAGATLAGGTGGGDLATFLFLPLLALWTAGVASTFFRPPANG